MLSRCRAYVFVCLLASASSGHSFALSRVHVRMPEMKTTNPAACAWSHARIGIPTAVPGASQGVMELRKMLPCPVPGEERKINDIELGESSTHRTSLHVSLGR